MEIRIQTHLPADVLSKKPVEVYETQFLYIGFSRYDTTKHVVTKFDHQEDGRILLTEAPCKVPCLSRCYFTEHATVTVYSNSPRIWKEEVGTTHFFVQQPIQTAST
jgi:hypothetical protein